MPMYLSIFLSIYIFISPFHLEAVLQDLWFLCPSFLFQSLASNFHSPACNYDSLKAIGLFIFYWIRSGYPFYKLFAKDVNPSVITLDYPKPRFLLLLNLVLFFCVILINACTYIITWNHCFLSSNQCIHLL